MLAAGLIRGDRKRTWLSLARPSSHPRRRPPRCWSGRPARAIAPGWHAPESPFGCGRAVATVAAAAIKRPAPVAFGRAERSAPRHVGCRVRRPRERNLLRGASTSTQVWAGTRAPCRNAENPPQNPGIPPEASPRRNRLICRYFVQPPGNSPIIRVGEVPGSNPGAPMHEAARQYGGFVVAGIGCGEIAGDNLPST